MLDSSPRLISRAVAADRLGLSVSTLFRMEKRGELTPLRVGRSVRYLSDEVDTLARPYSA